MSLGELREAAILATIVDRVRTAGHFCGETLLQKATLFLKDVFDIPFETSYRLYHYGPFSFDLREKLQSMEADDIVKIEAHEYGATFGVSSRYGMLQRQFPVTLKRYDQAIDFVVRELAPLGVKKLEPLATALLIAGQDPKATIEDRVTRLREVKPHVDAAEARWAVEQVDAWRAALVSH